MKMNKEEIKRLITKHIKLYLINKKYLKRPSKTKYSQIVAELFFILEDLEKSKLYAKKNIEKRIKYYKSSLKYLNSKWAIEKKKSVIKELMFILSKF